MEDEIQKIKVEILPKYSSYPPFIEVKVYLNDKIHHLKNEFFFKHEFLNQESYESQLEYLMNKMTHEIKEVIK